MRRIGNCHNNGNDMVLKEHRLRSPWCQQGRLGRFWHGLKNLSWYKLAGPHDKHHKNLCRFCSNQYLNAAYNR